jgi:selenoprotein W-related protein
LTSKLLTVYKQKINNLKLIPSKGGRFEVSFNGDLVYSKLTTGKFPDEKWVVEELGKRVKA